jgi:hypothetical protein
MAWEVTRACGPIEIREPLQWHPVPDQNARTHAP